MMFLFGEERPWGDAKRKTPEIYVRGLFGSAFSLLHILYMTERLWSVVDTVVVDPASISGTQASGCRCDAL